MDDARTAHKVCRAQQAAARGLQFSHFSWVVGVCCKNYHHNLEWYLVGFIRAFSYREANVFSSLGVLHRHQMSPVSHRGRLTSSEAYQTWFSCRAKAALEAADCSGWPALKASGVLWYGSQVRSKNSTPKHNLQYVYILDQNIILSTSQDEDSIRVCLVNLAWLCGHLSFQWFFWAKMLKMFMKFLMGMASGMWCPILAQTKLSVRQPSCQMLALPACSSPLGTGTVFVFPWFFLFSLLSSLVKNRQHGTTGCFLSVGNMVCLLQCVWPHNPIYWYHDSADKKPPMRNMELSWHRRPMSSISIESSSALGTTESCESSRGSFIELLWVTSSEKWCEWKNMTWTSFRNQFGRSFHPFWGCQVIQLTIYFCWSSALDIPCRLVDSGAIGRKSSPSTRPWRSRGSDGDVCDH